MFVTERNWIDFVVKGAGSTALYIERVTYDSVWWQCIKEKLDIFYDEHLCIEIAYPRIKYGLNRLNISMRSN
jgi:hypothetical protein